MDPKTVEYFNKNPELRFAKMRAYTMREMKSVVQYLVEHEAYAELKGRKLWMILADSSLTHRSWQSLKENFQKRILPDIHNPYYGLSMEQIRSFRQGRDLTTKDVPLSQDLLNENDNVKANSANPRAIAENVEAVNDAGEADSQSHIRSSMGTLILTRVERNAGEEDSQSNSSQSSSSMEKLILVMEESSNQEGAELDKCSENISSTKLTVTQPVIEVSDNVTERVSLTQNGCVSPTNSDSDAMPIRKNCSNTESRINKSLPVNNRDKSPVQNQFNIGPSHEQKTNKDHSVSTKNAQNKSVLTYDSHFRNDPRESLKGFNNDETAKAIQEKAYQEAKRRNSLAYSNRRNSMTVQGNCQKTISENRDCHVRTINDSRDNENVRINENPTCSKYIQPSLISSLENQSDKQSSTARNSDPNKEKDTVPKEKDTKVIVLNSQSDSDSVNLIERRKRIKRKRAISRMPQWGRENLQKILRMPLENLDAEGPSRKCNCSKTCALSKNNATDSDSNESTTCHRSSRDIRQSYIHELSSSDEEIPVEPYKSPEEDREFWKQKYIDQEKKTNQIMQSLQKIKTKLDCQENAFADLRKQLAVDKNFAFVDLSTNREDEMTSRNEDEDKENGVKIHISTKSQDIRLKGDWKDICSDFKELLKVLKIVSPTRKSNTVEELHDKELQSQAAANNVPVRRGSKPENKKSTAKGKSRRGRSKKDIDNGNKKIQTPVRKSRRISMMKRKFFAEDSDDDEQSTSDSLKLPASISSPAMSFIQPLNPNDYQDSIMSSSKTNRKKKKYSLCEERITESHFMKSLLSESPNIRIANFSEQIREPKIMPEICDNISLTNTSSITLPPTPEISSIKNMYPVNRRRSNGSTYTLYDTDVPMPLLNQDVEVFKERTLYQPKDYLSSNDTKLNLKTKVTPNADITETQSLFALFRPLKEKIKSLFPGRVETKSRRLTDSSVAVLDENKSIFHSTNVMKAKKSKKRTSTPLKRKNSRKSKSTVFEPIKEPSVELLQQKDMSSYNIFDDQYKKKKTGPFGNEKKKFISKSSKASLCGSSDVESSLLQDSIELIHNHSETCLFANEQKYVPPPRSFSAITTPLKSTIASFEKEKIIDKTIFDPDLLNSDANDCYSPTLNNMFSGNCDLAASNDVSYDGSMMEDLSREISPQPRLRASLCNLLAKNQSTDSSLFP